ncbi:hypothetical protein Hdeb2414_s0032g00713961 [Helianthus debilis subsp. tardiflorus]
MEIIVLFILNVRRHHLLLSEKKEVHYFCVDAKWYINVLNLRSVSWPYKRIFTFFVSCNHINFNSVKGDTDVKATPSLIDEQIKQKTPSIDKECTLATSTVKRTKQKVLDINGKGSPSSKKLKDEIADDDPSKKTNGPSMAQSEGFDYEETGMTDQANGKKGVS